MPTSSSSDETSDTNAEADSDSDATTDLKECQRCGTYYEGYLYLVRDDISHITANKSIDRRYGDVCRDCRAYLVNNRVEALTEAPSERAGADIDADTPPDADTDTDHSTDAPQ